MGDISRFGRLIVHSPVVKVSGSLVIEKGDNAWGEIWCRISCFCIRHSWGHSMWIFNIFPMVVLWFRSDANWWRNMQITLNCIEIILNHLESSIIVHLQHSHCHEIGVNQSFLKVIWVRLSNQNWWRNWTIMCIFQYIGPGGCTSYPFILYLVLFKGVWIVAFCELDSWVSLIKTDKVVKMTFASVINYISGHVILYVLEVLEFHIFWYWLVLSSTAGASYLVVKCARRVPGVHNEAAVPTLNTATNGWHIMIMSMVGIKLEIDVYAMIKLDNCFIPLFTHRYPNF
jgi:hypothetical protein